MVTVAVAAAGVMVAVVVVVVVVEIAIGLARWEGGEGSEEGGGGSRVFWYDDMPYGRQLTAVVCDKNPSTLHRGLEGSENEALLFRASCVQCLDQSNWPLLETHSSSTAAQ